MAKKNLYWLKGIGLGALAGFILYFLGWIMEFTFISDIIPHRIRFLIASPMCDPHLFPFLSSEADSGICFMVFGIPFNILFYGLMGLIIGIIIQIKNRPTKKNGKKKK